ncbi:hypothetical protein CYMTET_49627 [Cymbomonas tetramitiformis]|uniref:Uncharacterized protein n=1 Tax=Cymbomonas tetramitiformis TaxID=36881 RepID=A0AAE0BPS3_9CHLO|nr:hypothetical protein CYMTET_49627 [Cymbomonas tetramitiformis]
MILRCPWVLEHANIRWCDLKSANTDPKMSHIPIKTPRQDPSVIRSTFQLTTDDFERVYESVEDEELEPEEDGGDVYFAQLSNEAQEQGKKKVSVLLPVTVVEHPTEEHPASPGSLLARPPLMPIGQRAPRKSRNAPQPRERRLSVMPETVESLALNLKRIGCFFGHDPDKWTLTPGGKEEKFERDGYIVTRTTGTYQGTELQLLHKLPFYDARIPAPEPEPEPTLKSPKGPPGGMARSMSGKQTKTPDPGSEKGSDSEQEFSDESTDEEPEVEFSRRLVHIQDEKEWQAIMKDRPYPMHVRRTHKADQLSAMLAADGNRTLRYEGAHGIWEIAVKKTHHNEIPKGALRLLVKQMTSPEIKLVQPAAAAVWSLCVTQTKRRTLCKFGGAKSAMHLLERTIKTKIGKGGHEKGEMLEAERDLMQEYALGIIAIMSTDKYCRPSIEKCNPSLSFFFDLLAEIPGYCETWTYKRRKLCASILAIILIRDQHIRMNVIKHKGMLRILDMLKAEGRGAEALWLAGSAIMQCYSTDDMAMDTIVMHEQVVEMFEKSLSALDKFVSKFEEDLKADKRKDTAAMMSSQSLHMIFNITEYTAQGVWGSAYYCFKIDGKGVKEESLQHLAKLALRTHTLAEKKRYLREGLRFWHITQAATAALAAFAMTENTAELLVGRQNKEAIDPEGPCAALLEIISLQTRLILIGKYAAKFASRTDGAMEIIKENSIGAARVLVAAITGISYLTMHPTGQTGDACFFGTYRKRLLAAGAFPALLDAMEAKVDDLYCVDIVSKCGSVGLMHLTTMCTDEIELPMLLRYMKLIKATPRPLVVEHLVVGLWILMRSAHYAKELRDSPPELIPRDPEPEEEPEPEAVEDEEPMTELERAEKELKDAEEKEEAARLAKEAAEALAEEEARLEAEKDHSWDESMWADWVFRLKELELEKRKDLQGELWGLKVMLRTTNKWLDAIRDGEYGDGDEGRNLIKMFEFMVACFWLYLIPEGDTYIPPRRRHVSEMDHPHGVQSESWWSVQVTQPMDDLSKEELKVHAVDVMMRIMTFQRKPHFKMVQMSAGLLWNLAIRSLAVEQHVVHAGAVQILLDVVNHDHIWPPSTRDTAASFMGELLEEWGNTEFVGGLDKYQNGLLKLLASGVPRLQAAGLRVLGHQTFCAPLGCDKPSVVIKGSKTNIVDNKGVTLTAFMVNKCLRALIGPQPKEFEPELEISPELKVLMEEQQIVEGVEDIDIPDNMDMGLLPRIRHGMRLLLNLSVMTKHQVHIAKIVLMPTLRISSKFSSQGQLPGMRGNECFNDMERDTGNLANAMLQNLASHPLNRTRFYKVELKGTHTATSDAQSAAADNMRFSLPSFPTRDMDRGGTSSSSRPTTERGLPFSYNRSPLCTPHNNRNAYNSPDGPNFPPVQNSEPDLESESNLNNLLMSRHSERPKVRFPPVKGAKEMTPTSAETDPVEESIRLSQQKKDFLSWMHQTFSEPEAEHAIERVTGKLPESIRHLMPRKDVRKVPTPADMVGPEDYSISNKESLPSLSQQLRRPLAHLWDLPEEAKLTIGKKRWEPPISEYTNPSRSMDMPPVADRLLITSKPQHATNDLGDAMKIVERDGDEAKENERFPVECVAERPSTRQRQFGRTAMTVLTTEQIMPAALESMEDRPPTPPMTLAVKVAPKRSRTTITFDKEAMLRQGSDTRKTKLAMFEHISGSKVYKGLFPEYTLPNGKMTHYYYQQGGIVDEAEVLLRAPPCRPTTLKSALQHAIPLDIMLTEVTKPLPGGQLNLIRPVPPCAPLPSKHILDVNNPQSLEYNAFADLKEDIMEFVIVSKVVLRYETREELEKIFVPEVRPPTPRTPWKLPESIFRPRLKESDAKAFHNTEKVERKMFEKDWDWLDKKEKFTSMLERENKANPKGIAKDKAIIEMKDLIKKHYHILVSVFEYYAALGSGSPFHIQLNAYTTFLEDCQIPSSESQFCKRSDCDTTFIVANYVAEKKGKVYEVNDEHALMRFEFLEVLIRIAISKYGKGQETEDPMGALEILIEKNILPNVPKIAQTNTDDHRKNRLYFEEVDIIYKANVNLLKAIYSRYRLPPRSGGLRKKVLHMDGWMELLDHTSLLDDQFTIQEGRLCYLWSRMMVAEEVLQFERYQAITFTDFLDALGRVADMKMIPTKDELKYAGYENYFDWQQAEKIQGEGNEIIPRRKSAHIGADSARPLADKIAGLLDIIFRSLWFDPKNPEAPYTPENLLRHLRKIDKALGA